VPHVTANEAADQAEAMLQWPHSGFHVHDRVWVGEEDRPFALRLARYCARNPVALERLRYDAATAQVTYRSDKTEGPTAGSETLDALEFLARLVTHIPDPGQVLTRHYGWYANRTRGARLADGGTPLHTPGRVIGFPTRTAPMATVCGDPYLGADIAIGASCSCGPG